MADLERIVISHPHIDHFGMAADLRSEQELFPDLPVTEVFIGMSEAISHLDLLKDDGQVAVGEDDRYQAT